MTTLLKSICCPPVSLRASRALCDLTTGLSPALPSLALLCARWRLLFPECPILCLACPYSRKWHDSFPHFLELFTQNLLSQGLFRDIRPTVSAIVPTPHTPALFSFSRSHLSLFSKVPVFLICLAYFLSLLLEWKFQEGWDFCLFYLSL